jgi:hypothetical protein
MRELITVTPAEMGAIQVSQVAVEAYKFFCKYAGRPMTEEEEADFVSIRGKFSVGARDLTEFRKALERLCKDMKEVTEHAYNIGGPESLPDEGEDGVRITWSKQSYTPKWAAIGCSAKVVRTLSEKGILDVDDALCELTVDAVIRASGLTKDKLIAMFPDDIVEEPKKRTLSIK